MGFERTIFLTYLFETSVISGTSSQPYVVNQTYGFGSAIHCNYIQRIETNTLVNKTINLIVPDGSLLPFLKEGFEISSLYNGFGWTANRFLAIVQIVNATGSTVVPNPANWSVIDVTPQLNGYPFFGEEFFKKFFSKRKDLNPIITNYEKISIFGVNPDSLKNEPNNT